MTSSDEQVLRFVAASFPSVWALELLLAIKHAEAPCTRLELIARLRASELVVDKSIDALVAGALASEEGDKVLYLPVSREVEDILVQVEKLYSSRPNAVRRAIVTAHSSSARAFAEAFKFRSEGDD